jgi:signal transduction histidine kinase
MSTSDISNLSSRLPAIPQSAPLPHWHGSEHSAHVVQLYSDDAFLLDAMSKFVGTALGAGDSAVVIATQAHLDGLAQRLRTWGLDIAKSARCGRYVALDAVETLSKFMRHGMPDPELFAKTIGPVVSRAASVAEGTDPRVAAYGEMVVLLWADGNADAAIKLERLWNDLARTHTFSLLCAYPLSGFHDAAHVEPFLTICSEHSAVIPGEDYSTLVTEQDRLRNVALLQQKAEALETEKALLRALRQTNEELEKEVAERRDTQRRLCESELSLREFSGRLLRTQDEERRRLGRELHDSVGQYLAVLKMGLDSLNSGATVRADDPASRQLAECLNLAEQSIKELRTMSYLLYPPMLEEMGLTMAIHWYIEGFSKRSGIDVHLETSPALGRLPRDVELAAFRVLQESLTNVHRHSGSSTAQIRVRLQEGSLHLEIKDVGMGIPADVLEASRAALGTMGVGLRSMNERVRQLGGILALRSDQGTTVSATLPCQAISPETQSTTPWQSVATCRGWR